VTTAAARALQDLVKQNPEEVAAKAAAAGCPAHAHNGAANGKSPATAKRLQIVLDRDLCQGHAVCIGEAPEVFRLGADGKVETITDEPAAALHAKVRLAEKYCPQRVIRVKEV
jgi:sterol 14-demethylase